METQTLGPVQLPEVIKRVVREHKLTAFARMISFEARLAPAIVQGDAAKIRTIIDNLISNAIKYSPRAGTISLDLGIEGEFAVLDVIDQGPGVDPADRPRVFESFYQGQAPPEGRVKGSGLGLAITRENVLAHGGRIEVQDRADGGHGARFRVFLPLAQLDLGSVSAAQGRDAAAPATASGRR
jgi:two-component system sensor histidine kinase GlrK